MPSTGRVGRSRKVRGRSEVNDPLDRTASSAAPRTFCGLLEELVSQSVQLLPLALLGQRVDGRALEPVTGRETCTQEAVGLVRLLRGG